MANKVLYFSASWCAPCRVVGKHVDKLEAEFKEVEFEKIDVDEQPELALERSVRAVPTLVHLQDGQEVARVSGAHSKKDLIRDLQL